MSTTTNDATAQLAELEEAVKAARAAEREARGEQEARQRAVPEAKRALTDAYASGGDVKAAEKRLEAAQKAAEGTALESRIEGLARARRQAEIAVNAHVEANIHELIEALRPRAEAAVAGVLTAAAELEAALLEWSRAGAEVARIGSPIQWFGPRVARSVPTADQFNELRKALGGLRMNPPPAPMPTARIESPREEQEREQREHQEEIERRHAIRSARASGVVWDPDHPLGEAA